MAKVLDIKDLYVSFDTYAGEVQAVEVFLILWMKDKFLQLLVNLVVVRV